MRARPAKIRRIERRLLDVDAAGNREQRRAGGQGERGHDWQQVPISRGKYAGQPCKQLRCSKCDVWQTELSIAMPCTRRPS